MRLAGPVGSRLCHGAQRAARLVEQTRQVGYRAATPLNLTFHTFSTFHAKGTPVVPGGRAELYHLSGDAQRERAGALRDLLADVFNPLCLEVARALRERVVSTALDDLPRLGGEPEVQGFERGRLIRFARRLRYDPRRHDVLREQVVVKQEPVEGAAVVWDAPQFRQFNRGLDEALKTGANPLDLSQSRASEGVHHPRECAQHHARGRAGI